MTILTCDYNGHKEIYTADGKEVDYSTFCDLRAKNAIEANQTALKSFLAKHKNKPNLAGFKTGDILVSSSDYSPTFFNERAFMKVLKLRRVFKLFSLKFSLKLKIRLKVE